MVGKEVVWDSKQRDVACVCRKQGVVSCKDLYDVLLLHNLCVTREVLWDGKVNIKHIFLVIMESTYSPTVETLMLDDCGRSFGGNWDERRLHQWLHIRFVCFARLQRVST